MVNPRIFNISNRNGKQNRALDFMLKALNVKKIVPSPFQIRQYRDE